MFGVSFIDCKPEFEQLANSFLQEWEDPKPYVVAHTSGSTGTPKEIRLLKSDMLVSARSTNKYFDIRENSVIFSPLSASYIAGKMTIVRAIAANCQVVFTTPSNHFWANTEVNRFIENNRVSLLPVVPSQLIELTTNPHSYQSVIQSIDNIIIGGAAVSRSVESDLRLYGDKFHATYGMTETCSHVAVRQIGQPTFNAMPGITFAVDSRDCLTINAPAFSFKSLQTNDIVTLGSDCKSFIWRGRFDNVVNSGGIKIFPEELEQTLQSFLEFPFFIKGIPDDKWGEVIELVTTAPLSVSDEELIRICRSHLPSYAVPKSVRRISQIQLTSTGKIKRI